VNVHIPDGTISGDYDAYCAQYEQCIKAAGGIDLQILGIGRNGHVGFNEPTSSLASRTRLKALSRETVEDNRHFFANESEMPKCAITMALALFSIPVVFFFLPLAVPSRCRCQSH